MRQPLVSVLLPCYNAARWVGDAIESALAQTWLRTEVIVVDDGSRDESLAAIRRHESARVKVIASENRGSSAARNTALGAAQGEFFQYLDADDLLSPDKIAAQITLLLDEPPRLLATSPIVFFNDGEPPEEGFFTDDLPYAGDSDSPVDFLLRLYGATGPAGMVQTSQWLTPRNVSVDAGPWDDTITVDNDGEYFARVVLASAGVRFTPHGRVYYRKHPAQGSLSAAWNKSAAHLDSGIRALDAKLAALRRHRPDPLIDRTFAKFYAEWALGAYPSFPELSASALATARRLAGRRIVPDLGNTTAGRLRCWLGWKLARRLQVWWHR